MRFCEEKEEEEEEKEEDVVVYREKNGTDSASSPSERGHKTALLRFFCLTSRSLSK
jgi:hypothetical protein